jgi:hypothetical protein
MFLALRHPRGVIRRQRGARRRCAGPPHEVPGWRHAPSPSAQDGTDDRQRRARRRAARPHVRPGPRPRPGGGARIDRTRATPAQATSGRTQPAARDTPGHGGRHAAGPGFVTRRRLVGAGLCAAAAVAVVIIGLSIRSSSGTGSRRRYRPNQWYRPGAGRSQSRGRGRQFACTPRERRQARIMRAASGAPRGYGVWSWWRTRHSRATRRSSPTTAGHGRRPCPAAPSPASARYRPGSRPPGRPRG